MNKNFSFFPTVRAGVVAGVMVTALAFSSLAAQSADPAQTTTTTGVSTDGKGTATQTVTTSTTFHRSKKKKDDTAGEKTGKTVQTKDTKRFAKKDKTAASLVGVDAKLPDKQLYDKAVIAMNKGHFDVARLDLQTMLNTYPDSQYQMRAKLAIADSWYKEGGTAALTQAESEYADFRVFFPNAARGGRGADAYWRHLLPADG